MKEKSSEILKAFKNIFTMLFVISIILSLVYNKFDPDRPDNNFSCFAFDDHARCSFIAYLFNSFVILPLFLMLLFPLLVAKALLFGDFPKIGTNSYLGFFSFFVLLFYIALIITWFILRKKLKK